MDKLALWGVVPVKPLHQAKSRLAEVLFPEARYALAVTFLRHVVGQMLQAAEVSQVVVTSRDPVVLGLARELGAHVLEETSAPELNAAVEAAARWVYGQGATHLLVMPADLPLVSAADIDALVCSGAAADPCILAPNQDESGTNALLVPLPLAFSLRFGADSYHLHHKFAQQAGIAVHSYHSPAFALDIDTPADLERYHSLHEAASRAGKRY